MYLYGDNCCLSCIYHNPDKIYEIYINKEKSTKYYQIISKAGLINKTKFLSKKDLILINKEEHRKSHDIAIFRKKYEYCLLDNIIALKPLNSLIVILDQIIDQNNLGNIIRSSLLIGVGGIILTENSSAQLSTTTATTSSGAIEKMKFHLSKNLSRSLKELKKSGYWVYSLDMNGERLDKNFNFDKRSVLIVGNEGKGIRKNILDKSDFIISLHQEAIRGIDSYNAANSLAIAAHHYKLNLP